MQDGKYINSSNEHNRDLSLAHECVCMRVHVYLCDDWPTMALHKRPIYSYSHHQQQQQRKNSSDLSLLLCKNFMLFADIICVIELIYICKVKHIFFISGDFYAISIGFLHDK